MSYNKPEGTLPETVTPQTTSNDIIGNKHIKERLRNIIVNKRLANAYIFSGPEGIGKKITAVRFAQTLLCNNGTSEPCMTCISCLKVPKNTHPNLMIIRRENYKDENGKTRKNIPIEAVRDIEHYIRIKPIETRIMVVIIDNAHELSQEAMNTMLKTLEEPPTYAIIILITHIPTALLPTIHSRCQSIMFYPISHTELKEYLKSNFDVDNNTVDIVSNLSNGKINLALSLLKKGVTEHTSTINSIQDCLISGRIDRLSGLLTQRDKHTTERENAKLMLELILLTIRDVIICKELQLPQQSIVANDRLLTCFANIDTEEIITMAENIINAQRHIDLNANVKLTFENAILNLATGMLYN